MFVILLENSNNTVLSEVDTFTNHYPRSSIKRITRYTTLEELHSLANKPLLSIGWLIICQDTAIKNSYLKFLEGLDQSNLVLFRITSEQKCSELLSALKADKVQYRIINNYKLKEEKVIDYVCKNLSITKVDAKYLCTRSGYYLPEVVKNVQTLKVLPKITKPIIRKYTEDRRSIAVYDLVNYLIGIGGKTTYEDCMQLVYEYRYGFEHLLKTTLAQITMYIKIYNLILDGELTLANCKIKKKDLQDKEISNLHDFRLYKIVESFDKISYDYLILLQLKLQQISPKFYSGVFDFVALLKINAKPGVEARVSTKINTKISSKVKEDLKTSEKRLDAFNRKRYTMTTDDCQKAFEYLKEQRDKWKLKGTKRQEDKQILKEVINLEYQNILKYLQIANKPIEFPITIVEKCKDFSKELSGVYVYFDNEDIENIKDAIIALGTPEAHHCAQLFTQIPGEAYKMILMRSGWSSFTDYFINQYGSVSNIFVYLNKGKTDQLVKEQQSIFSDDVNGGIDADHSSEVGDNHNSGADDHSEVDEALAQELNEMPEVDEALAEELNEVPEVDEALAKQATNEEVADNKAKEIEDFIDSMIISREIEEEEKEEKEEKKRLVQKKRELHSELNSLLKTNNVNNDSLNLGISARDLAKWKEKSKKFSSEVDKSSPRKNTFKEKSDDKEYPSSQNNSPPKPISEQKESTEEQKIATENQEVNAGQELFSKDPTTNLFSKEMDEEELNDEDVEDATAGVNGGIADDLKVPHLIGHLTELMANSEEDLKKDLKDTQKELQEKFKEDFKKEFNEDLEESFNRFQENLGRSLKNQSIVDKTQLTEIHEDFSITKEHLEDTKRLLENIVDNNNSEKVTELLQQISEVSNTISKDQLDTKEELTILIKKVEGALAEFSKDTNEKLAINSDVLAEIKKVEGALAEFSKDTSEKLTINSDVLAEIKDVKGTLAELKDNLSDKFKVNTDSVLETKNEIQLMRESCKEIISSLNNLQEKFSNAFYEEDDDEFE